MLSICAAYWRMCVFGICAPEGALCFIRLSKPPTWKVKYTITRARPLWRSTTGTSSSFNTPSKLELYEKRRMYRLGTNMTCIKTARLDVRYTYIHPFQNLEWLMRRFQRYKTRPISITDYSDALKMTWMTGNLQSYGESLEFPCAHSKTTVCE